jgi:DNA polymerase-3 subunit gamma/tau
MAFVAGDNPRRYSLTRECSRSIAAMSYRVLARKYRSRTFDEVVGQSPVATTLSNAIRGDRVHHGYLFTGTRGVGKTTMARILAKSLNCLQSPGPTVTPCCACDSCVAIGEGEDVDVIEIDAASNTGVDNIRDLRSNATLRPARSRFKIYIIDEVHMLSTQAFNALLKTLEEPPGHVKFILATTELQKVPATIVSRCQQFDFNAIDARTITRQLDKICKDEGIKADEDVLRRLGRLGNGSMRDALSLLDKLVSYESQHLTLAIADEVIPPRHDEQAAALIEAVAAQDASAALAALETALQTGRTVERLCDDLIEHLRTLMLMRVCGPESELVDVPAAVRAAYAAQAGRFDAPTFVYMISLLEELRRNVKYSGAGRALADAAVVRLAMARQFSDIREWIDGLSGASESAAAPKPAAELKKNGAGDREGVTPGTTATVSEAAKPADEVTRSHPPKQRGAMAPSSAPGSARPGSAKAEAAPMRPAPVRVSSEQWQRVAADPLVLRVKEAVDGRLVDVRPRPKPAPTAAPDEVGNTDEVTIEPTQSE